MTRTMLFLCPHSATKSVMAAAYFQRLADQRQLDIVAAFAGTEPDPTISPPVAELLQAEGIDVTGFVPRLTTPEELAQAWRVISLGCEMDLLRSPGMRVEQWDDVPPPSQNLAAARAIILSHVERLIEGITPVEARF